MKEFEELIEHDRNQFREPNGWQNRSLKESLLIKDFSRLWNELSQFYQSELTGLSYAAIPSADKIANSMEEVLRLF